MNNDTYYLKTFKYQDKTNQRKFNWAAAIFGPFWALYRKMYIAALPSSVAVLINVNFESSIFRACAEFVRKTNGYNVPMNNILIAMNSFWWTLGIWSVYQLISSFVYGIYGNELYYEHVKKKISRGYHLAGNISATTSIWNIVLIIIGVIIASEIVSACTAGILWHFGINVPKLVCVGILGTANFCTLFVVEFLYYKADAITVRKSIPSHPDLKISEENIRRYLAADGWNIYKIIIDVIIVLGVLFFIGLMLYVEP